MADIARIGTEQWVAQWLAKTPIGKLEALAESVKEGLVVTCSDFAEFMGLSDEEGARIFLSPVFRKAFRPLAVEKAKYRFEAMGLDELLKVLRFGKPNEKIKAFQVLADYLGEKKGAAVEVNVHLHDLLMKERGAATEAQAIDIKPEGYEGL